MYLYQYINMDDLLFIETLQKTLSGDKIDVQTIENMIQKPSDKDIILYNFYKEYALKGNSYAQNALALCYLGGIGVTIDVNKYFEWCEKSDKQNNDNGQVNLGNLYGIVMSGKKGCSIEATNGLIGKVF